MNRRSFFNMLGKAAVGATVAYSFPEIIIPKNIVPVEQRHLSSVWGISDSPEFGFGFTGYRTPTFHDLEETYKQALLVDGESDTIFFININAFQFIQHNDHRFEMKSKLIGLDRVLVTITEYNPPKLVRRLNLNV